MKIDRPTASTLYILWQWDVRNILFHFSNLRAVKEIIAI